MEKWTLFKLYVKSYVSLFKKSVELLWLFKSILSSVLTKDYLSQYPVSQELREAFEEIEVRARPLSKEIVESFEAHAFKEIERTIEIDFVKDDHYQNPDTKDLTSRWTDPTNSTIHPEDLESLKNKYTGEFGDIKDEQ